MSRERRELNNEILAHVRTQLIMSRLLILQSKRLMLNSLQRRLDAGGRAMLNERIEAVRMETQMAQHSYRRSVLSWGSAHSSDYWVIAYSRLIEVGNALTANLREATSDLPVSERFQVSAEVEMLEEIVGSWSESLRAVMTEAVA